MCAIMALQVKNAPGYGVCVAVMCNLQIKLCLVHPSFKALHSAAGTAVIMRNMQEPSEETALRHRATAS